MRPQNEIQDIYSRAAMMPGKLCKKSDCELVVQQLVEGETLTTFGLAVLRAHFLAKIPAKPKTSEQWVQKAVAQKDVRFHLGFVNALSGSLRASDGHRMHIAKTFLADGYYDRGLCPIEVGALYPELMRAIPAGPGKPVDLSDLSRFEVRTNAGNYFFVLDEEFGFNRVYLYDALCNPAEVASAELRKKSSLVIKFVDGSLAAIMGFRLDT